MGPAIIGSFIPIFGMAMAVIIVYIAVSRKHVERVELIKRGVNPEKYDLKLPGRLGLPWGVIFLALGLGPAIAMIIGDGISGRNVEEFGLALAGILGGIGLIIYWKITAPERERILKLKEELLLREGPDFEPNGIKQNEL